MRLSVLRNIKFSRLSRPTSWVFPISLSYLSSSYPASASTPFSEICSTTMAEVASSEFLEKVKDLYPRPSSSTSSVSSYAEDPWFIIAAVSFASSNRPEAVPKVLEHVLRDLDKIQEKEQMQEEDFQGKKKRVVLRMREAILKGGLICGYSRVGGLCILCSVPGLNSKIRRFQL